MEIGLREWLVIGGIILIALIVLDGWRRMRSNRAQLRMKIDRQLVAEYSDEPDESFNPELPNGGARVMDEHGGFIDERHHIEPTFDTDISLDPEPARQYSGGLQQADTKSASGASRNSARPAELGSHSPLDADPDNFAADAASESSEQLKPENQPSADDRDYLASQWGDESDPLFADPGAMPELRPEAVQEEEIPFSAPESELSPEPPLLKSEDELLADTAHAPGQPVDTDSASASTDEGQSALLSTGAVQNDPESSVEVDSASATEHSSEASLEDELDFTRPISQLMEPSDTPPVGDREALDYLQHSLLADDALDTEPTPQKPVPPLITDALSEQQTSEPAPDTDVQQESLSAVTADSGARHFDELPGGDMLSAARPARNSRKEADQKLEEPASETLPSPEKVEPSPAENEPNSSVIQPKLAGKAAEEANKEATEQKRRALSEPTNPENVLVITVVAGKDKPISGTVLHKLVEACGMQHGDMDIYHRFEDGKGQGAVQFSMANAVSPGSFDLAALQSLQTPAVSFFMSMEAPSDVMNAYECMLATAETVAKHMKAELLDEHRSVMRPQTKQHYRQRIRDFEMHNRSRRSN